jgi:hypothetical protein
MLAGRFWSTVLSIFQLVVLDVDLPVLANSIDFSLEWQIVAWEIFWYWSKRAKGYEIPRIRIESKHFSVQIFLNK